MDLGLRGRSALVCASTAGLGRASARSLADEGCHVIVTGRDATTVETVAAELAANGLPANAVGVAANLDSPAGAEALADAVEALGDVDILVLNGPGPPPSEAAGLSSAAALRAAELLVATQVALVHRFLPGMRARGWGRIVAVGSSSVVSPLRHLAASNLGRAALAGYLKTLASEVAGDGVTVNMVLPGRIATNRVAALDEREAELSSQTVDQVRQTAKAAIPAGRYGRPEEFGAVVAFLCGASASYVTGSLIRCDGGLLAAT